MYKEIKETTHKEIGESDNNIIIIYIYINERTTPPNKQKIAYIRNMCTKFAITNVSKEKRKEKIHKT